MNNTIQSLANVIKLNYMKPETYRNLIQYFEENNIFPYIPTERGTGIPISHEISLDINEVRLELFDLRHDVRNKRVYPKVTEQCS